MQRVEPRSDRAPSNIESQWLLRYLRRFHTDSFNGCFEDELDVSTLTVTGDADVEAVRLDSAIRAAERVGRLMPNEDWRKLRAAWTKHKNRQRTGGSYWQRAERHFRDVCKQQELDPALALSAVTLYLMDNPESVRAGADMIKASAPGKATKVVGK